MGGSHDYGYANTSVNPSIGSVSYSNVSSASEALGAAAVSRDYMNSTDVGYSHQISVSRSSDGSWNSSVSRTPDHSSGGGGGWNPPPQPPPLAVEPWPIIGDINFWGAGYKGQNKPCPVGTSSWDPPCNSSCTAFAGWACDTRAHTDPVTLEIYANGVLFDTFKPTGSAPGLTNNWWANLSKYAYTPNCGVGTNFLYNYRYPTPLAWKDGVTRTITIKAIRPSDGVSRLMVNAGWGGPKSFPVTCPATVTAVDLAAKPLVVSNQVEGVPYSLSPVIRNVGNLALSSNAVIELDFDYAEANASGQPVFGFNPNGGVGDFKATTTLAALAIGQSKSVLFQNIENSFAGNWRVRAVADPAFLIEPNGSPQRTNNQSAWSSFHVAQAPSILPDLSLLALPVVTVGQNIELRWAGTNIQSATCQASNAWSGAKNCSDGAINTESIPTSVVGTRVFTLSGTGTNGDPISRTVPVTVTDPVVASTVSIALSLDQSIIRSGESAQLRWTVNSPDAPVTCAISGGGIHYTKSLPTGLTVSSIGSNPLTNQQTFTMTCTPTTGNPATKSATVEVIPTVKEN